MYSIEKYTNWLSPGSFSRKLHTLSSNATLYFPHNLCQWSNTILQRKIDNNDNNDNNIKKRSLLFSRDPTKTILILPLRKGNVWQQRTRKDFLTALIYRIDIYTSIIVSIYSHVVKGAFKIEVILRNPTMCYPVLLQRPKTN